MKHQSSHKIFSHSQPGGRYLSLRGREQTGSEERKFYKHEFLMERYRRSTRQEAVRAGGQRGREDECEWDGGLSRNTGLVGTQ